MASANIQTKEMEFLHKFAEDLKLMVSTMSAAKGAIIGVICSGAGVLVGGPVGLVAGVAAGGVLGYMMNLSEPLTEHLKKLTPDWIKTLCAELRKLLEDLVRLSVEVMVEKVKENQKLKNKIVEFLNKFFMTASNVTVSLHAA